MLLGITSKNHFSADYSSAMQELREALPGLVAMFTVVEIDVLKSNKGLIVFNSILCLNLMPTVTLSAFPMDATM